MEVDKKIEEGEDPAVLAILVTSTATLVVASVYWILLLRSTFCRLLVLPHLSPWIKLFLSSCTLWVLANMPGLCSPTHILLPGVLFHSAAPYISTPPPKETSSILSSTSPTILSLHPFATISNIPPVSNWRLSSQKFFSWGATVTLLLLPGLPSPLSRSYAPPSRHQRSLSHFCDTPPLVFVMARLGCCCYRLPW